MLIHSKGMGRDGFIERQQVQHRQQHDVINGTHWTEFQMLQHMVTGQNCRHLVTETAGTAAAQGLGTSQRLAKFDTPPLQTQVSEPWPGTDTTCGNHP